MSDCLGSQILFNFTFTFIIEQAMNTVFAFMNLGGWELLLIMLVILIFFGAKRIPDLARGLGKGIREFKDATTEIKDNLEDGGSSQNNTTSKTDSTESSNTKDQ